MNTFIASVESNFSDQSAHRVIILSALQIVLRTAVRMKVCRSGSARVRVRASHHQSDQSSGTLPHNMMNL